MLGQENGPTDPEHCTAPAQFEVHRHLDISLIVCAEHVGPVLLHANNVMWPPQITLLKAGEHPEHAVVAGSEQALQREAAYAAEFGDDDFPDGAPPGLTSALLVDRPVAADASQLTEALLALGTACPAAGAASRRKDVPVLLGALLSVVETTMTLTCGPETVPDVLRGYKSTSHLVNDNAGWATMLHLRQARTAMEIGRVLDSETSYAAENAAHLASGLLRLESVRLGRTVGGPGGPVPVKDMYRQAKVLLTRLRQAMDQEVRTELGRAGHRV
ncbi:hypothetical protein [Kitasatospora sp. GP82]|uniref:hypothetical protein n=1 Tax=Kitasatospora sp. GP82 TaxID=3035089 RepID=UPI002474E34A|nr:hypothetical protein [Kitasatospora sp. GP82]MDH6129850.1 hypothetical protein [Kitasatospora sp. GP82]